jgi:hypothetical protein
VHHDLADVTQPLPLDTLAVSGELARALVLASTPPHI